MNSIRQRQRVGALVAAAATLLSLVAPGAAQAVDRWNTDPYQTGCARDVYTLSTRSVAGGQAFVKYSRTCGTNWVEYRGTRQTVSKRVMDSVTRRWTRTETDTLPWSYSMQVSAPGTTSIRAEVKIGSTTYSASCASTCSWTTSTSGTSSTKASAAVAWARGKVGSMDYSFACERFVENAYGTSGQYASAIAAYNALRRSVHTTRTGIPAGALVFSSQPQYDLGYGHVSIAVGDGTFIAGGMDVGGSTVTVRRTTGLPGGYLGWTEAPSSWPGR